MRRRYFALLAVAGLVTAQIAIAGLDAFADELSDQTSGVTDGDTLTLRNAASQPYKIRPADIAANESDQLFGQRSCRSLVSTCYDKQATVVPMGVDRYEPPNRVLSGKGRQRWYQLRFDLGR